MTEVFGRLAEPVRQWVRRQGWANLRDVQVRATSAILDGRGDVIISAATAGGKTEAAFLPLLSQVFDQPQSTPGFDLLYVGPLKALITDQAERLEDLCRDTDLPVVPWHGDVAASVKARALNKPRGVLLITPESLEALLVRRGPEMLRLFAATRAVVIDELHSLLDTERGIQVRSLLVRLEQALKRPVRRIGLSATLGDMDIACRYLQPDRPAEVAVILGQGGAELQVQVRGYVAGDLEDTVPAAHMAVARHLFGTLRGRDNLVFAGARQTVERFADTLRLLCEDAGVPQEFFPHHANLSREHRSFLEQRLKRSSVPTTAVCTSTLELGIDIGDVESVAQIGATFSVASLRQRLGRSGRRNGKASVLRQYVIEEEITPKTRPLDMLRLGLIRAIAMIELLVEKWCEPPQPEALHLSTLVHQILSMIAQNGGLHAAVLYKTLCQVGPFRQVTTDLFLEVLRAIGDPAAGLIEQDASGLLLLGGSGEKLVEHYSFYAVFHTPEEYRVEADGQDLGSIPIDTLLQPGGTLIFSGRRWTVRDIDATAKVISLIPAKSGIPPRFGSSMGMIHDRVVQKMMVILGDVSVPAYLDATARALLAEARSHYRRFGLGCAAVHQVSPNEYLIATSTGSRRARTLACALLGLGFEVSEEDGFLEVHAKREAGTLRQALEAFARGKAPDLFTEKTLLAGEKYHPWLTSALRQKDALSSQFDLASLPIGCAAILARWEGVKRGSVPDLP